MPSFDTVSEVDHHELSNAIDQANREIGTRYDFKGSGAIIEQADTTTLVYPGQSAVVDEHYNLLIAGISEAYTQ